MVNENVSQFTDVKSIKVSVKGQRLSYNNRPLSNCLQNLTRRKDMCEHSVLR